MSLIIAGQYAAALIAIFTLIGMFIKWAVVKPIKTYIDQATYPISPGANGGLSLADANKSLQRIEGKIDEHIEDHKTIS